MTWVAVGSAGVGLVGDVMGSQAGAASDRAERGRKEKEFQRRKAAYDAMIGRAQGLETGGEQSFLQAQETQLGELDQPLQELEGARQNALTGNAAALQQGAGQMKANLAQQGARGGQASTLLNRGTGQQSVDAQNMINQMAVGEASDRRKMRSGVYDKRAGLFGGKAGTGYSGQLQQFGG